MFTVFINDNPLYFTDSLLHESEVNFFNYNTVDMQLLIRKLEVNEIKNAYLYATDIVLLFEEFKSTFKVIEAAGGVVKNAKDEILCIYRNDKWDLPKGKIEKNETIKVAALREVAEETGVQQLNIIKPLETTYHMYKYEEQQICKVTYWFSMKSDFSGELHPQLEEGITKVAWLNKEKIEEAMENTYANIKLLLNETLSAF